VRLITNINATDAMKFAISGGVTSVDDDKHVSVEKIKG
jgi:hypothetical protein